MKLIHCADLHLDSKMSANLDSEHAKERRGELLRTFERMVEYADERQVAAILIAGDLFDKNTISATAARTVLYQIQSHPQILFYYLRGNHDAEILGGFVQHLPENLRLFGKDWITYEDFEGVTVSGIELSEENAGTAFFLQEFDRDKWNIVMLHGQEADAAESDGESIPLKLLRNKGIDYLALGHIHAYKAQQLDARGIYCYPGCLEGRGFDECGEHGFVLLDIDEKSGSFTRTFVPFARRKLFEIETDVTQCGSTAQMADYVRREIKAKNCGRENLVKIVLTGTLDVECEKDLIYLQTCFEEEFYFVCIEDKTTLSVRLEDYLTDESLKGEFVRRVMNNPELSEQEKADIVRYGLQALAGEEVQ